MTDEKIRIAVAEAMGWSYPGSTCLKLEREAFGRWIPPLGDKRKRVPDYPNDLNACAEFQKTLTSDQQRKYIDALCLVISPSQSYSVSGMFWALATALPRQRCEAFLRTVGKWEEEG